MFVKLSAAAFVLALAVPALAQTTATISSEPTATCTGTAGSDCKTVATTKLGSNITPTASSEGEGSESGESEDD